MSQLNDYYNFDIILLSNYKLIKIEGECIQCSYFLLIEYINMNLIVRSINIAF